MHVVGSTPFLDEALLLGLGSYQPCAIFGSPNTELFVIFGPRTQKAMERSGLDKVDGSLAFENGCVQ